jgi:UDP-glucose 4-epimerase
MTTVIVTGSSGFIGGQTVLQLKSAGYKVVGIDLRPAPKNIQTALDHFLVGDFSSSGSLEFMLSWHPTAIIHCAGSSLVGPSVATPDVYYDNNFVKTKAMLDYIVQHNQQHNLRIIFSSSASVYGEPIMTPCNEEDPGIPLSPYGESKLMVEMMMQSYYRAYGIQPVMFRYFNACGADPEGRHGQEPGATHIIARVLESIRDKKTFTLNGTEFPTADGTCIRDYVHVSDIANAHILALNSDVPTGIYNLSTMQGVSNQEVILEAENVTNQKVDVVVGTPRAGDPAVLTASDGRFAQVVPGWRQYSLTDMIAHAWKWYTQDALPRTV